MTEGHSLGHIFRSPEILQVYEPFINSLVTEVVAGPDGKEHRVINEDWKIQTQMHLVEAIQKCWRELI